MWPLAASGGWPLARGPLHSDSVNAERMRPYMPEPLARGAYKRGTTVYRCPNITKQNNEKIHNAINEVSKGDCIIMGDFNHGNIIWDTLQSTGVEDSTFLCLVQDNFLTQHVLEPTRAARVLAIVLSSQK